MIRSVLLLLDVIESWDEIEKAVFKFARKTRGLMKRFYFFPPRKF